METRFVASLKTLRVELVDERANRRSITIYDEQTNVRRKFQLGKWAVVGRSAGPADSWRRNMMNDELRLCESRKDC